MCFLQESSREQHHILLIPLSCVLLLGQIWHTRLRFFISCQCPQMSLQQMTVFRLAGTRNRIYKIQNLWVSKWKTEFYQWDKISFISNLLCPPTAACICMQEARRWFRSYYPELFKVRITALPCFREGHKNKCKVTGISTPEEKRCNNKFHPSGSHDHLWLCFLTSASVILHLCIDSKSLSLKNGLLKHLFLFKCVNIHLPWKPLQERPR